MCLERALCGACLGHCCSSRRGLLWFFKGSSRVHKGAFIPSFLVPLVIFRAPSVHFPIINTTDMPPLCPICVLNMPCVGHVWDTDVLGQEVFFGSSRGLHAFMCRALLEHTWFINFLCVPQLCSICALNVLNAEHHQSRFRALILFGAPSN